MNKQYIINLLELSKTQSKFYTDKKITIELIDIIIKRIKKGEDFSIQYPFPDIINIGVSENCSVNIFEYKKIEKLLLRETKLKRIKKATK